MCLMIANTRLNWSAGTPKTEKVYDVIAPYFMSNLNR